MELYACPVRLLFTPQVDAWLELFRQTHELRAGGGAPRWERTTNTRRFDALTLQALEHLKDAWNSLISTESAARRGAPSRV